MTADLATDVAAADLVITGEGEKFFSAGADLKQFASGDKAAAREAAAEEGFDIRQFRTAEDFADVASLIVSPGIPHLYPEPNKVVAAAQEGSAGAGTSDRRIPELRGADQNGGGSSTRSCSQ